MTKPKTVPEAQKPLLEFLDSYDARLIAVYTSKAPTVAPQEIRTYLIGPQLVIVTLGEYGWDIYTPVCGDNDVAKTLEAAERILGPRPGELHTVA